jgi:mersacidin/lichenicidin family type 2 lantibiotic
MDKQKKSKALLDGVDIQLAWKDPDYRATLSAAQQEALLKENPVASDELSDEQLDGVAGGTSIGCFNPNAVR